MGETNEMSCFGRMIMMSHNVNTDNEKSKAPGG